MVKNALLVCRDSCNLKYDKCVAVERSTLYCIFFQFKVVSKYLCIYSIWPRVFHLSYNLERLRLKSEMELRICCILMTLQTTI